MSVIPLGQALRLERNVVLSAGAGTGKTHSLVGLALHLLAGARKGRAPLPASGLCLLTFTEKAALEMRSRLEERLHKLSRGEDGEVELRASFAHAERDFPKADEWKSILRKLPSATIGTFHAYCMQLLRQTSAPSVAGLEVLDEGQAIALLKDIATRNVIGALASGEPTAKALARDWGFSGSGRALGLVDVCASAVLRLREEGQSADTLSLPTEAGAREAFEAERRAWLAHLEGLPGKGPKTLEAAARARALLTNTTIDRWNSTCRDEAAAVFEGRAPNGFADLKKAITHNVDSPLSAAAVELEAARHAPAFRSLLAGIERTYAKELERRGVVDFSGLLVRARDLLRDDREARLEAQGRLGALLVDEFQDTSRLQLELVALLAERREGAGRMDSPIDALPLEPAFLCAVGDKKQSIYEFRGADVTVFGELVRRVEEGGGARALLQDSRRTGKPLVAFLNEASALVLRAPGDRPSAPYDIAFDAKEDALVAHRVEAVPQAPVVALDVPVPEGANTEVIREADAEAVAHHLGWLLRESGRQVVDAKTKSLRPIRAGDVGFLLRGFSQVGTYQRALLLHGVPHRVFRGGGFYEAQEVRDVAHVLTLVANPGNATALVACLRSPWVTVGDSTLLALTQACGGRLDPKAVLRGDLDGHFAADERADWQTFRRAFDDARRGKDHTGNEALLQSLFAAVGLRPRVAAGPSGEQALANLEKVLGLAASADERGTSLSALAESLRRLADDGAREAEAELVPDEDDAVVVCTVHQAKGLEWPVVVLADLFRTSPPKAAKWVLTPAKGMAFAPPDTQAGDPAPTSLKNARKELRARAEAEERRLLYVAMTRARDVLVLGRLLGKQKVSCWGAWLAPAVAAQSAVVEVPPVPATRASFVAPRPSTSITHEDVAAALARVEGKALGVPTKLSFTVTALAEAERARENHSASVSGGSGPSGRDVGTDVHALLERLPWSAFAKSSTVESLRAMALGEGLAIPDEALAWVQAFVTSPVGLRLGTLGERNVVREWPFMLSARDGDAQVLLSGAVDVLVQAGEGEVWVLDYKTTPKSADGAAAYALQLETYALAAKRLFPQAKRVRTGIVFLRHGEVAWLDSAPQWTEGALVRLAQYVAGDYSKSQVR